MHNCHHPKKFSFATNACEWVYTTRAPRLDLSLETYVLGADVPMAARQGATPYLEFLILTRFESSCRVMIWETSSFLCADCRNLAHQKSDWKKVTKLLRKERSVMGFRQNKRSAGRLVRSLPKIPIFGNSGFRILQ